MYSIGLNKRYSVAVSFFKKKKLGVAVGASHSVQLAVVDSQQCRSTYRRKCSVWYSRIL